MRIRPVRPGPGQESVWDYPRPPRLERSTRRVRVVLGGVTIVDSTRVHRVLETSHPPGYYVPPDDVLDGVLSPAPAPGSSWCEFKGRAAYWTASAGVRRVESVAWSYPDPTPGFEEITDELAFYPGRVDACYLDEELVRAQEGGFYGGWISAEVVGPFKGAQGTRGW